MLIKIRTEYTCALELVHDMVKGKWKPIILWRLHFGATSLAKPERDIYIKDHQHMWFARTMIHAL